MVRKVQGDWGSDDAAHRSERLRHASGPGSQGAYREVPLRSTLTGCDAQCMETETVDGG